MSTEALNSAFLDRWVTVDQTKALVSIRDITLEDKGNGHYIINGFIKPLTEQFERTLTDSKCNTALSIRALSNNKIRPDGSAVKELIDVITFDVVDVAGMGNATKYMTGESLPININMVNSVMKTHSDCSSESSKQIVTSLSKVKKDIILNSHFNNKGMKKHSIMDDSF